MPLSQIETASLSSGLVAPTATALTTASGSAPSYSARAWVNFNGTGTVAIRASGNVSSITDNGVGDYTVNFATAIMDANYSACATIGGTVSAYLVRLLDDVTARTTLFLRLNCNNAAGTASVEPAQFNLAIFR